jgi:TonB-dependent receptor
MMAMLMVSGSVVAHAQGALAKATGNPATDPAPAPATAPQAAETSDANEIVVRGIRASLQSAAARKRDSAVVIDSIAQEDLGKFPDANIAEALQRIPGVSIDRSNGEGQFVTVRGMGPQFNTVLFNGRSFASDNYGREFSFDLLAAELISGADVYKTSQARLQDGGIGSTINLRTARPLDRPGFHAVATAKGNYEQNNEKVTPQLFGLVSDTFADNRIGVLASLSYQKRIASVNRVSTDGFLPGVTLGGGPTPIATDVYAPRNVGVYGTKDERTRLGATLVGQYQASDTLLVTLDGLYNKFTSKSKTDGLGLWFEPSQYTAATIDDNRTVTSLTTNGNADLQSQYGVRDTTTYEIGVNTDWRPSDTLHVVFDATTSNASNKGGGKGYNAVVGASTPYSWKAGAPGALPTFSVLDPDALVDPAGVRNHVGSIGGNDVSERVYEARLDTEWSADSGALKTVRFGGSYTRRSRTNTGVGTLNVGCFYCGYVTPTPASLLSPYTIGSIGSGGGYPTTFLSYDPAKYIAYLGSPESLSARDQALKLAPGTSLASLLQQSNGAGFAAVRNPPDTVREAVYAGYAETDFEGRLGGVPWFVNMGARYVHTEVRAESQQRALVDVLPVAQDPTNYRAVYANNGAYVASEGETSYDVFLPDINVRIKPVDQVNIRLGASQTLTRPTLNDLRPVTTFGDPRPAILTGSGGNPALKPYRATNLDLSLEYYPTPSTTIALAAFYKTIKDFIVTTVLDETIPILNSADIPVGGIITGRNEATAAVARPRNADSANVRGLELNVTTTFDWLPGILSGFGTQLNATFVSTDRTFAKVSPQERFAVVGLGNSQNAVLFYEKYGLSARIAYNRRDRFLSALTSGSGDEPLFIRTYGQFDASASYDVTPHAQVFVEGTNIFNAKYVSQARFDNQLRDYINYGARFDAGVRLKF